MGRTGAGITGPEREAWIVVDLGFGDAGKGATVDFLVRERRAAGVIRFNGGAQAGHRVVTPDGRSHIFSQLGAGSFVPGARTHLASSVVTHPLAMLFEAEALARAGVTDALDRLTVSPDARVITPFHQAAGRLRELARGDGAHGTCGVGVGEVMRHELAGGSRLRFGDLRLTGAALQTLSGLREELRGALGDAIEAAHPAAASERALLEDPAVGARWLEAIQPLLARPGLIAEEGLDRLLAAGPVVFEGAQGVLLDEWRGFHPHTTWSTCTAENAERLLDERGYDGAVTRLGVLRSYGVRHGRGPFPAEDAAWDGIDEAGNDDRGWQGRFRRGGFDAVLGRYALSVCPVDGVALTHLDRRGPARVVSAYRAPAVFEGFIRDGSGDVVGIRPGPARDLDWQQALGQALAGVVPVWRTVGVQPEALTAWVEEALEVPVVLTSTGPSASDRSWR